MRNAIYFKTVTFLLVVAPVFASLPRFRVRVSVFRLMLDYDRHAWTNAVPDPEQLFTRGAGFEWGFRGDGRPFRTPWIRPCNTCTSRCFIYRIIQP